MQAPIRVRAKPGVLVPVPCLHGSIAMYVGRGIDHEAIARNDRDDEKKYPVLAEATEFSVAVNGQLVMTEIRNALRCGDLLLELKEPAKTLAQEVAAPRGEMPKGKG